MLEGQTEVIQLYYYTWHIHTSFFSVCLGRPILCLYETWVSVRLETKKS